MKSFTILFVLYFSCCSLYGQNIKFFHEDGTIKRIGETSDKLSSDGWYLGEWKDFANNGNLNAYGTYLYKDGKYKIFDYKGSLILQSQYITSRGEDVVFNDKFFNSDGTLLSEGESVNGFSEGKHIYYFPDGSVSRKISFKRGIYHGEFIFFNLDGSISSTGFYRSGKKYGFSQEFYEDGLLKEEGNYVLDTKDGLWKRYNLKGEKSLEIVYNMGEVMKYPCRPEFCPYVQKYYTSPTYPMRALRDEGEGCVMVEFTLSEKGIPLDARVLWSKSNSKRTKYLPDDIFDKPALESVKTYRYRPQHIDGIPTAVENVQSIIVFRIEGIDSMPQECKS